MGVGAWFMARVIVVVTSAETEGGSCGDVGGEVPPGGGHTAPLTPRGLSRTAGGYLRDVQTADRRETLPRLDTLGALVDLVGAQPGLFVRWSKGPDHDRNETSRDHASGLELPGLAVNPLDPPGWWTRPVGDWVARQITAYDHLGVDQPEHYGWVLGGRVVERGPDNEPLVADVEPVARLATEVLHEASARAPSSSRPADAE